MTIKLKWGCPKCGARGEETLPEGVRPDQSARYNIPAAHRNASPGCRVEHPDIGDKAYDTAPGIAASERLKSTPRTDGRGN